MLANLRPQTTPSQRPTRRGATVVETALVLGILILFLLSIFEFGRYFMMKNVLDNAAREGCRYAVVHTTDSNVATEVQTQVTTYMAGQQGQFPDLAISVFPTNSPSSSMSTVNPDDPVTVKVTGTYSPMFPTLLFLPVTISMKSSCTMTSEGN